MELPISFLLDDFPYFEFSFSPYLVGQADPEIVGRIWRDVATSYAAGPA